MPVRDMVPVVAVSAAVHIFALNWISVPRAVVPLPLPKPFTPPPPPPPEAIEVSVLDEPGATGGSGGGGGGHAIAVHGGGSGGGELRGPGTTEGARYFKMRGPELGIGGAFLDTFLANSKPVEGIAKTGKVAPNGRGTSIIRDRVTTIDVERDGTAHFHDAPDFDIHLQLPIPSMAQLRDMGRELAGWGDDVYRDTRVGTMGDQPEWILAEPGACGNFNELWCQLPEQTHRTTSTANDTVPIAGGKAELTDYLYKKLLHADPYASRKLALLDSTRAERAQIGEQYRAQQLDRASELVRRNLEALWRATADPAQRRDALFAMWDECAEGDGPIGEAGERARATIIGWIRSQFAAGFTADDLARLNARRSSKQPFAP